MCSAAVRSCRMFGFTAWIDHCINQCEYCCEPYFYCCAPQSEVTMKYMYFPTVLLQFVPDYDMEGVFVVVVPYVERG